MRKSIPWLVIAILVASCGQTRSPIEGKWTPESVLDCSDDGVTVEITDRKVTYHNKRSELSIMRVSKIVSEGGGVDIDVQPRKYDRENPNQWHSTQTLRFLVEGDKARLLGTVMPDGEVVPFDMPEMLKVFTMKKCS